MKIGMVYSASISYEIGGGIPHEYYYIHTPLGLAYPLAMIKSNYPNIKTKIIDQALLSSSNERILDLIRTEDFDLIGFSAYVWNSKSILYWIKELKKENKDLRIVIGGPHFTYIPKLIMKRFSEIDFIIKKEGEIPFLKLVEHLKEDNSNYEGIPNLVYRQENKIFETTIIKPPLNLDEYASPYLTGILDDYLKDNCQYLGFQTSRGCPYNCAYCVWNIQSTFENFPKIRYFSFDRVIKELKYIQKHVRKNDFTVDIYDATFNENQKRLSNLSEKLRINNINLPYGVRLRADLLNDSQIDILKSMGVKIIKVGIESVGNCLKTVRRSQSQKKISENLKKVKKAGIYISCNIIIGLPNQTKQEVNETLKFVKLLNVDGVTVNIYDPPNGTDIYNNPEKYGMTLYKELEDGRTFLESNQLSRADIIQLAKKGNFDLNHLLNNMVKLFKNIITFS
ncbi:MAG: B12-binding domain-containing radical SAM protein [Candidatus Helarchaeota archaeon]